METPPRSPGLECPIFVKSTSDRDTAKSVLLNHLDDDSEGAPFFVVDLGTVHRQFNKWKALLPRVEPFYAVSPVPSIALFDLLC